MLKRYKNMSSIRKVITMTFILCIVMIFFCYTAFKLGSDKLLLTGNINIRSWLRYLISAIIFMLQFIMQVGFSINEYSKKLLLLTLPYLLVYIIGNIFFPYFIITAIAPFIYIITLGIYRKNLAKTLLRYIIYAVIIIFYQYIAIAIKSTGFSYYAGEVSVSYYRILIINIDLLILSAILFTIGGEKFYAAHEHIFYPEAIGSPEYDREDHNALDNFSKYQGFQKVMAMALLITFQLIQWTIILVFCHIGNVFIEGLVITASFVIHGLIIKRRWHSNNLIICTLGSALMFYVAAKSSVSFYYSQLFPVIVGLIMVYILYRVSVYIGSHTKKEQAPQSMRELIANIDIEFLKLVDDNNWISAEDKEILRMRYKDELYYYQIAQRINMSDRTVIRKLNRIYDKLKPELIKYYNNK